MLVRILLTWRVASIPPHRQNADRLTVLPPSLEFCGEGYLPSAPLLVLSAHRRDERELCEQPRNQPAAVAVYPNSIAITAMVIKKRVPATHEVLVEVSDP
jgi:hypothetical protein